MASLLLAEDQLEELTAVLDGIAGGAAPGNITAGKLRSLASSAHRAAARLQAFEDKQYNRAEQQAANKLFKQAVHMSSSDDSSDDDAATTLDQAAVDELRCVTPLVEHDLLDGMKRELPAYLAACAGFTVDHDDVKEFSDKVFKWWQNHHSEFPTWAKAARMVFSFTGLSIVQFPCS